MSTAAVERPLASLSLSSASSPHAPLSSSTPSGTTGRSSIPSSYLDLRFHLPQKRYVGLLACQRDPLLSTLTTRVVRCDKVTVAPFAPAEAGKKAKKGTKDEAAEKKDEWEVELEDTVLFPEGGGQPSDVGRLYPLPAAAGGGEGEGEPVEVRQVVRRNLDAVHFCSAPVEVGREVRVEVEMGRREDLMQQHSGQHLLSAVLEQAPYNLDTLSWSLQPFPELCYIELPRAPSASELAEVEEACNKLIAEERSVRVRMELATEESGVKLGEKVPENYRDEGQGERPPVQRTVIIDGLDENPCCGTHYPSLSHLRTLFLSPFTTSIRSTNARIYFAFGQRALTHLSATYIAAREAALAVGCSVPDLAEKTEALVKGSTEGRRREKKLKEELAGWVAKDLVAFAAAAKQGGEEGVLSAALLREDDATNELPFLTSVASDITTFLSSSSSCTPANHLFLLASGATSSSSSAAAAGGAVLIFGSEDLVTAAGKKVVETFGKERVKGGGKGRWQGKVSGKWENGDGLLLRKIVEEAVA
ncbi:hypothetical protein JCM8547_002277 [Rhodosporidiobolus lusitaniae]